MIDTNLAAGDYILVVFENEVQGQNIDTAVAGSGIT